jgi:2'-5' RNA ligase
MLQEYGFPKEEMEFNPHVTIARIKYPQKLTPDVNLFLNSNFDPIKFPINRVQFLSSELISTGVVYTLIKSFPLGESLTKEK